MNNRNEYKRYLEKLVSSHAQLSTCSANFLEFIERNPAGFERSNYQKILELNNPLFQLQPWPLFINQQTKMEMQVAALNVFRLIKKIPGRLFANNPEKMAHYYEIPIDIARIQFDGINEAHLNDLVARGDFISSSSGWKCLEFNITAKIGGMQVSYWQPLYLANPIIAGFLRECGDKVLVHPNNVLAILLEHLLEKAVQEFPNHNEINIVMVIPGYKEGSDRLMENIYLNQLYKNVLSQVGNSRSGKMIFCDYQHLKINANKLYYERNPIAVLLEMYHGVVPEEIFQVFKTGNVCLFNGPVTKLLSNKLNLALLSENEDSQEFDADEKEIIKKYIPWTRKVVPGETTYGGEKIKLEVFIFAEQERLVLKPPMGFSGDGICIGKNTPPPQWEIAVKKAFKEKNWLVQEYIESQSYLFQKGSNGFAEFHAAWGLYTFGSRFAGAWIRILPLENNNGIINSGQGAEETVAIEVEEWK